MAKINFSVIVTVFNEEKSIDVLLRSLINQTHKPGEIIIVDAGSTDDTVLLVKVISATSPVPIRVLVSSGVNRSRGRNIGIDAAKNTHIAVIDAGCEANPDWLEQLATGFVGDHNVVAGFYVPVINKPVQRLFARYVSTLQSNLDESTYLPSSRSIAFTKEAWQSAGGYPEQLDTCEDLVFAVKLKETGSMTVRRDAIVLWRQADSCSEFFSQIRGYARGDVEAMYLRHVIRILSVWLRYFVILLYPPLIFVYILYTFMKMHREIKEIQDIVRVITTQLIADGAVMMGSIDGIRKRLRFWRR